MATNQSIRGQEATIRVSINGQQQIGSWLKVKDFTVTERTEFLETDYLGELTTDLDRHHSGYDFSFSVDMQDRFVLDFITAEVDRERNQLTPSNIVLQVIYAFRNGANPVGEVYFDVVLKVNEQSFGGRTEYISYSIEGKAKRREALQLG